MEEHVDLIVQRFNAMLESDGANLSIVRCDADLLELSYQSADGAECDVCVLDPADLEVMVSEALTTRGVRVPRVRVLR